MGRSIQEKAARVLELLDKESSVPVKGQQFVDDRNSPRAPAAGDITTEPPPEPPPHLPYGSAGKETDLDLQQDDYNDEPENPNLQDPAPVGSSAGGYFSTADNTSGRLG